MFKFRKANIRMKLLSIILITACLLTSLGSYGQEKKVALGLSLSPTVNWFKTNSTGLTSNGNKMGFNYGLIADFNFGENYAYSTGIFINNGGGKLKYDLSTDTTSYTVEEDIKIQSIRMPITLRMMTKEIGYFRYYGLFGFNLDYVINATADRRINGGADENDIDIISYVEPVNLSLSLGIGFLYNISGTTNFIVGLSFNNGFINVIKEGDYKATANQFALNLGVLF
jgi:hypothetical protein